MHRQLPNGARCPNFDLSLYLHHFYVCESSEGSGDIYACVNASKTHVRAMAATTKTSTTATPSH